MNERPNYKPGDRVRIIGLNRLGTIRGIYGTQFAVEVDDYINFGTASGCFYYRLSELETLCDNDYKKQYGNDYNNQEETNMNYITNYLNIANVRLSNDSFSNTLRCANFNEELKVGDFCVVSIQDGLHLAKIIEIIDDREDINTNFEVVAIVNTDDYDKRVEQRAKAEELKAKMQERAKKLQDIALYQMLAKDDSDMAKLLEEYQALTSM